ncbi:MAG: gamma carbonic anhydrase family protein [Deltaproteobacteria bacterium]|nr:gamma carbonic anhydrase family protein [Deltaproteobacteria bacterium]
MDNELLQVSTESYCGKQPRIGTNVLLCAGARIIGDVTIGDRSSIWYNVVIRGDVNFVRIGEESNIQDGTVIHVTHEGEPSVIGNRVTVGHKAMLHACTIGDLNLVGMGAIVLDGVTTGESCMIAAGSLLPPGKHYPPRTLILGSPARVVRDLSDAEVEKLAESARHYCRISENFLRRGFPDC